MLWPILGTKTRQRASEGLLWACFQGNSTMSTKRHKKFVRSKEPPGKLVIGERDLRILRALAEHRFLTSEQLFALDGGGRRNLQRRLQYLFHLGFVDRPSQQLSFDRPQSHIVYALGDKGADLLCERLAWPRGKVDWTTKNRQASASYIWHGLMISQFWTVLSLALRGNPASLVNWQQGAELRDHVQVEGRRLAIVPDAFFTIEEGDDLLHFFLEADRSTMSLKRFWGKMRAYWEWWKQDRHRDKFDISRFRVLTITLSDARKDNLRDVARRADDLRRGSAMFLFACEKSYNLQEPESILCPIWHSPRDGKSHHLLE